MKRYFEIDNVPEIGRINSFLCYVTGKRGDLHFLNCDVRGRKPFRIKDWKEQGTHYYYVRLLILGEAHFDTGVDGPHDGFAADSSTLQITPIHVAARFPTGQIFVRLKRSRFRVLGAGPAMKSAHKALAACFNEGLDVTDFCHEMTQEAFERAPIIEKEEAEKESQEIDLRIIQKAKKAALETVAKNMPIRIESGGNDPLSKCYDQLSLSYDELVNTLKLKYGPVQGNYFKEEGCERKNLSILRGTEGLFVHHIDEDKIELLSNPVVAREHPFVHQTAERLVYCDILEHLILHIDVLISRGDDDVALFFSLQKGICIICQQVNDCFSDLVPANRFRQALVDSLVGRFEAYIAILFYLLVYVECRIASPNPKLVDELSKCFDGTTNEKVHAALSKLYKREEFYTRLTRAQ